MGRTKLDNEPKSFMDRNSLCKSIIESGLRHLSHQLASKESSPDANLSPNLDDFNWGYCTEVQLEEILLKNLEFVYNEAISKLVALGYDEDVALKAILRNGHCYGAMDVLTNIMHNSLAYLNSGGGGNNAKLEESETDFVDLKQLEAYSLAAMVCLLQQVKPNLSKGDAMWCLLMSDLHVGRASVMDLPVAPSPSNNGCDSTNSNPGAGNEENGGNGLVGVVPPPLCKFHGGWGFSNGGTSKFPMNGFLSYASEMSLQREIVCPKRFNLTPSMKALLKRNVAMFAAGFRANSKESQACTSSLPNEDSCSGNTEKTEEPKNTKNQEMVNLMLSKFRDLNLDGNMEYVPEDQKDEMILSLFHQIKDLEGQVKERKEWAHQKAMQAARKLSHDLTELKSLRMEREEIQRLKQGETTPEDPTMNRLKDMEKALRTASGQVDSANSAVKKLETENAEIRAEMEASKLSASESVKACLDIAKREKKCLKRLLAWEKQKAKLQEEIAEEKQKILELEEESVQIKAAQKVAEAKWRQEQKAKELALAKVEEDRRLKEATEAAIKRKQEALRLKIEIDFQRHKDDLQRLEQELSRLKFTTELPPQGGTPRPPRGQTINGLIQELEELDDSTEKEASYSRECVICMKEEVSVVFLPCAHQVLCASCNESYMMKGRALCPCCRVHIEQRIRVFGASS
ncbi:hypothetical protein LguiA_034025 [Lonicera macranthoides]